MNLSNTSKNWLWATSGPFLFLSSWITHHFFYIQGVSDFYFNLAFDLVLIYALGPRALIIIFASSMISTVLIWNHQWIESPLFAIPEVVFSFSSWILFKYIANGDSSLKTLKDLIGFILLGLLIPYLFQHVLLLEVVSATGYQPRPSDYIPSLVLSLSGDMIPLLSFCLPLLYLIHRPLHSGSINIVFLVEGVLILGLVIFIRAFIDFERFWFLYGLIILIASINRGFKGALLSVFLVTLGSLIIPAISGFTLKIEPEKIPAIYLGNSILSIFSIITGRTISDLRRSNKTIQQLSEEKISAHQRTIQVQQEQTELLESKVQDRTLELKSRNDEISAQNEELTRTMESLAEQRDIVVSQKQLIEQQHHLLVKSHEFLEQKVKERTKELELSNNELTRNNSHLLQFSYTISHNLRGPLASILGLLGLVDLSKLDAFHLDLFYKVQSSAENLDAIINDLNQIIELNNRSTELLEEIRLEQELIKLKDQFRSEILENGITIQSDFSDAPTLVSVKSVFNSILYQLFKNSIQYKALHRKPEIILKTKLSDNDFIMQITDNGLGIDLNLKDKIFMPFKRLHFHTEGKGLGLFLAKYQAEMLRGNIEVQSEVNKFTTFTLFLPRTRNITEGIVA